MEPQVKNTVKAESVTNQFPTVRVERILEPRSDKPFRGLMLRWTTEKQGTNSSILSQFLGNGFKENRVTIQTMADSIIEELGITEGVNINEAFKAKGWEPIRISISEITTDEYESLDEADQAGYSIKRTPDLTALGVNGKAIYRKTFVDTVDGSDDYVKHDDEAVKEEAGDVSNLPV